MGLRDVTGVFSRYFVVGYFVPSFLGLAIAWIVLPPVWLPSKFDGLKDADKIYVIGALALFIGLTLLGLNRPIVERLSGTGLEERKDWRYFRHVYTWLIAWQNRRARRYFKREDQWAGLQRYPADPERYLPTALGNAERAARDWPFFLWGLDTTEVWPRIELLLSDGERQLHWDALSDREFFLNSGLAFFIVGLVVLAAVLDHAVTGSKIAFAPVLLVLSYALYTAAVEATTRWGRRFKGSVDLHRFDLYRALGLRLPASMEEERDDLSYYVNEFLLNAAPVPSRFAAKEQ